MNLLAQRSQRITRQVHTVFETNKPAYFREPRVHHEDVATIASPPDRPLGIRRMQLAVTRD
jgi:hypothetical protein